MKGAEAGYSYQHYASHAHASHNEGEMDRSKGSCCGETVMARYTFCVGALFTLVTGPYAGAQFVAATQESDFYVTAVLTLLVFGCSLAMAAASSRRPASRVWVVAGLAWVLCGYVIYLRKDFTEKPVEWLYIATIQAVVFSLFCIPIIFTDPWTQALM